MCKATMALLITFFTYILLFSEYIHCERASTWDYCGCNWLSWQPWSSCTATCGGGSRNRARKVEFYQEKDKCEKFNDCASDDMGWEDQICGTNCNRGDLFPIFNVCVCDRGWKGTCCTEEVTCGKPSSISHGSYSGSRFTYDQTVVYSCNTNYKMTDPSTAVRTCSAYGYWSGTVPRCEYAVSCNSYPCRNGAYCTNLLSDYKCTCRSGWTGKNCETDIQPPVVKNCPSDKRISTSNMTHMLTWSEPSFSDPHGREVIVSKNYQISTFDFPWGEFTVQYTAVKPFNGLTESCLFKVSVKPFPCNVLNVPANGIMVCNGWNSEYARVCKLLCLANFTYLPGFKASDWYTCGSSGNWFPAAHLSECLPDGITFGTSTGDDKLSFEKCNKEKIGAFYIRSLQASQFNSLCGDHMSLCKAANLNIICN